MAPTEPLPPHPDWPRYSDIAFPRYRFVPGLNPHPRLHPLGHSFSLRDEPPPPWRPQEWRRLARYLYGIDLYNYAYWWECHETLEGLWHAAGRKSAHAFFVQAIIHVAAANLQRHRGNLDGARRQAEKGLARFERVLEAGRCYMGLDVPGFTRDVRESLLRDPSAKPAMIRLRL